MSFYSSLYYLIKFCFGLLLSKMPDNEWLCHYYLKQLFCNNLHHKSLRLHHDPILLQIRKKIQVSFQTWYLLVILNLKKFCQQSKARLIYVWQYERRPFLLKTSHVPLTYWFESWFAKSQSKTSHPHTNSNCKFLTWGVGAPWLRA
jgi:hypothetical protein